MSGDQFAYSAEGRQSTKVLRTSQLAIADNSNLSETYFSNTNKEELCLEYARNFDIKFKRLYPKRDELYLVAKNEHGVEKFIPTTLRPTLLPFREIYDVEETAAFVANYLHFEPLEVRTAPPSVLPSPTQVLEWSVGDCFDFAMLLCSFLLGAGYDAFVVHGKAPRWVCLRDQSSSKCPFLMQEEASAVQTMAEAKVAAARDDLLGAQWSVSEVQEQLNIFSVESEAGALQSRILATETVLADVDPQIAKLETVAKDPNDSRFVPLRLERQLKIEELANLRSRLTGDNGEQGPSMARLGADLELARVEQATANLMYTSALNSLETAIATAEAQSTYLETVVQPSKPTKASKPERLQNTGLVFLICFAVYILGLLTISLIREQAAI